MNLFFHRIMCNFSENSISTVFLPMNTSISILLAEIKFIESPRSINCPGTSSKQWLLVPPTHRSELLWEADSQSPRLPSAQSWLEAKWHYRLGERVMYWHLPHRLPRLLFFLWSLQCLCWFALLFQFTIFKS